MLWWGPDWASAQLTLVPDSRPQSVFAGSNRKISVVWRNTGDEVADVELRFRLYQGTAATAVLLNEAPLRRVKVLPGQTVSDSAVLDFPAVRAETRFMVQWLDGTNRLLGTTHVSVYPTNLLGELKLLAGDNTGLGLYDPHNQIKPVVRSLGLQFADLEGTGLENFSGKLAVLGPFMQSAAIPTGFANRVKNLASNNVAVVWLVPPPDKYDKPRPSFYAVSVPGCTNAIVVAQADTVASLADDPRAQLNLLHFCRLALRPEEPQLPFLTH